MSKKTSPRCFIYSIKSLIYSGVQVIFAIYSFTYLSGCAPVIIKESAWKLVAKNEVFSSWVAQSELGEVTPANGGFTTNVFALQAQASPEIVWLIGAGPGGAIGVRLLAEAPWSRATTSLQLVSPRAHAQTTLGAAHWQAARHWASAEVAQAMQTRCPSCAARLHTATAALPTPAAPAFELPNAALAVNKLSDFSHNFTGVYPLFISIPRSENDATTLILWRITPKTYLLSAHGLIWGFGLVPDLRDAAIAPLIRALQQLQANASQLGILLPEQGAPLHAPAAAQAIDENLGYWRALQRDVCALSKQGATLTDALQSLQLPPHFAAATHGERNRAIHQLNLQRAWLQAEAASFSAVAECEF